MERQPTHEEFEQAWTLGPAEYALLHAQRVDMWAAANTWSYGDTPKHLLAYRYTHIMSLISDRGVQAMWG